jgi:four helix bundle protein
MDGPGNSSHRNLVVWQKSMAFAKEIYLASDRFPRHELFGLTSQMRRAAVSIPSNIAEGAARNTTRAFVAFLYVARGSQAELETQLRLAASLEYLDADSFGRLLAQINEIGRLLTATIAALSRRIRASPSALSANR